VAGLLLAWPVAAVPASRGKVREPTPLEERGAEVGTAILVEYYQELPRRRPGEKEAAWAERLQEGLEGFRKKVLARYNEGTLQRLLQSHQAAARRAAVLSLGLVGTMNSNPILAEMLHDSDARVRRYATDALWQVWFQADKPAHNQELQRLVRLADAREGGMTQALAGLNALIRKAPRFAEAYNQRAILYYRTGQYQQAVSDCAKALKLNPHHFGAASGLAQSYLKIRKPRAALKAFRTAYRINPRLEDVGDQIRDLENLLGGERP
jgi:tetratricopeptide (TPR) repeat protein